MWVPCFLFLDTVRAFQRPSFCRLAETAFPTPDPRSKFTFTFPSESSSDMKSFCKPKERSCEVLKMYLWHRFGVWLIPCPQWPCTSAERQTWKCGTWRWWWTHLGSTWWVFPPKRSLLHPAEPSPHCRYAGGYKNRKSIWYSNTMRGRIRISLK